MEVVARNTLEVFGRRQFRMYRVDIYSKGLGYIVQKRRRTDCGIVAHVL